MQGKKLYIFSQVAIVASVSWEAGLKAIPENNLFPDGN